MSSFTAKVAAFQGKAERRMLAVFRQSAQELAEQASVPVAQGGKMPVDTGALRNSIRGATGSMPDGSSDAVPVAIMKTMLGDKLFIGWTVAYALRIEHGFFGTDVLGRTYAQKGYGYARSAAQNWQEIVNGVVERVNKI